MKKLEDLILTYKDFPKKGIDFKDVLEILQGLTKRGNVVGVDLVEVSPAYDPSESTQVLAAQLLLNFIGFIFHNCR